MTREQQFFARVGARIREIRTAKRISQHELARRIRSYQQNVARSEAGTNLTLDVIYRIANALDVEPIEFFKFQPPKNKRKPSPSKATP